MSIKINIKLLKEKLKKYFNIINVLFFLKNGIIIGTLLCKERI